MWQVCVVITSCHSNTQDIMLGPHWIQCTTKSKGVHTASQTKATAIYALSELRFMCSHRKDVRSHREGTYTPSGVYQRKTTTIVTSYVIRYSHADWLKLFFGGTYVLRLVTNPSTLPSSGVRCRPHCRLAISKIQQENFHNIARL